MAKKKITRKLVGSVKAQVEKDTRVVKQAFNDGVEQGRRELKAEVLTLLQVKYLAPDAPDKGTPEADAIISLAATIASEVEVIPFETPHPL